MSIFEEEVRYFLDLIESNITLAKTKRGNKAKEDAVFLNFNIRNDGQEVAIFDFKKDYGYTLSTKEIESYNFESGYVNSKCCVLYTIKKLTEYANNKITFKELSDVLAPEETLPKIKNIIEQKYNISEQLRLLRRYRNDVDIQTYIDSLYNHKYTSEYVKYLIDRYYYNKKDVKKAKKDSLEKMFKIQIQ